MAATERASIAAETTPLLSSAEQTYDSSPAQSEDRDDELEDKAPPEGPTVTRAEEWAYYLYYNGVFSLSAHSIVDRFLPPPPSQLLRTRGSS